MAFLRTKLSDRKAVLIPLWSLKGPFTLLKVSHTIACLYTPPAGVIQHYHLYINMNVMQHMTAPRVQLSFKVSAEASDALYDAIKSIYGP